MLLREIKRRSNKFLGLSMAICLVAYFAYHLVEGRRGLLAWQRLDVRLLHAQQRIDQLDREEKILAHRVNLLHPQSVCTDLLIERAKEVLGYVHPHEVVVMNE